MVTTYILILVISAGLMAFCAGSLRTRLARVMRRPMQLPEGAIALTVSLAMLVVVAAPLWLCVGLVAAALALNRWRDRLPLDGGLVLLVALLPLIAAPLLGATAGFAIDAALIAAAMLGESYAS